MKKTKRPTEQELLHQWLEGDLDLILDQILMIACERRLDQLRQA